MTVVTPPVKNGFFFSSHATSQLRARSNLNRSDVIVLLSNDIHVPVGIEKNHIHSLIYSVIDDSPFVVVYDDRNKEIITVLYVEYNNRFMIDPKIIEEIKQKTLKKHNSIVKEKTKWINFFTEVRKSDKFNENISLYFVVTDNNNLKREVPFTVLKNSDFAGDVSQICKVKNIALLIENERKRLKIEKDKIINICTRTPSQKVIPIANSKYYVKN